MEGLWIIPPYEPITTFTVFLIVCICPSEKESAEIIRHVLGFRNQWRGTGKKTFDIYL